MAAPNISPDSLLRLREIIGQTEVTPAQAEQNRRCGKGPKRPRPGISALVNVCSSTWWSWTAQGIAPEPVRLCGATFWRASDVLALRGDAANSPDGGNPPSSDSALDQTDQREYGGECASTRRLARVGRPPKITRANHFGVHQQGDRAPRGSR